MSRRNTTTRDRLRARIKAAKPACHICGQAIDYSLSMLWGQHSDRCARPNCRGCVPHPDRFELDHITPLAKGGTDTIDNAAASHRRCNSTKRARLVAPIVRRSGSLG